MEKKSLLYLVIFLLLFNCWRQPGKKPRNTSLNDNKQNSNGSDDIENESKPNGNDDDKNKSSSNDDDDFEQPEITEITYEINNLYKNNNYEPYINSYENITKSPEIERTLQKPFNKGTNEEFKKLAEAFNIDGKAKKTFLKDIDEQEIKIEDFLSLGSKDEIKDSFTNLDNKTVNILSDILLKLKTRPKKPFKDWNREEFIYWLNLLDIGDQKNKDIIINSLKSGKEITIEDFKDDSLKSGKDIYDSFSDSGIDLKFCISLFNEIAKFKIQKPKTNSGIVGFQNLGNTCFINTVVQCLLQTPGLIQYFRTPYVYNYNGAPDMYNAFKELTNASLQENSKSASISPNEIVQRLRESDVKFEKEAQGDALSAICKIIELLDENIRKRKIENSDLPKGYKGLDQWVNQNSLEDIKKSWKEYDPIKISSPVRENIHFMEKTTLECIICNHKETWEGIHEKLLLPLKDNSMEISLKEQNGNEIVKFEVLNYVSVKTLKYQILHYLKKKNPKINIEKDIDKISIKHILGDVSKEIEDDKENKELLGKTIEIKLKTDSISKIFTISIKNNSKNIDNINHGIKVYEKSYVMDRGSLKCKCSIKKSLAYKKSRKVINYPKVLIITIDRYKEGKYFDELVKYNKTENFGPFYYDLYGVVNKSGGLSYGHYWAFVKSIDNNKWYNANDANISDIRPEDAINKASAIILMYTNRR